MRMKVRALACALWMGLIAGCGGGGGGGGGGGVFFPAAGPGGTTSPAAPTTPATPTTPETPTTPAARAATLQGQVTLAGVPVADAQVQAGGQTVKTDAQGRYNIGIANPSASVVVLVKSAGRLTMAKQAPLAAGQTTTQDVQLQAADVQRTFLAADGVIAIVNGAVIDIPKNAVQDATGAAYDGPVQLVASYRSPTTAAGIDAFPQPYQGEAGNERFNLQTVGVIEATLATPAGQPLQLRQAATLVYPGVSAIDRGAATIPLWHYDEARTLWVQEGEAARQPDGSYLGQVSHFSAWNLDMRWGGAYTGIAVEFCVNFQNGAAGRYGVRVHLDGPGFATGYWTDPLEAGPHEFQNVPAYAALSLRIVDAGNGTTQTIGIPATAPGQSVDLQPCISVVGTADYVPTPPPPPPIPVPANAAPSFADGYAWQFGYVGGDFEPSSPAYDFESGSWSDNVLSVADNGRIVVRDPSLDGGIFAGIATVQYYPQERSFGRRITGQMAVGGYLTMTGEQIPGANVPDNPYFRSAIEFTGRIENLAEGPKGTWRYTHPELNPAAPGRQPPAPRFSVPY